MSNTETYTVIFTLSAKLMHTTAPCYDRWMNLLYVYPS